MKLALVIVLFFIFVCSSFALVIEPDKISFGNTEKEERYVYFIKLENRTESFIDIVGIINDCGLNFEAKSKRIKPYSYTEGILSFNSGTRPGYFIQNVKVVYRTESGGAISTKSIEVRWYNRPEMESRIFVLSEKIDLDYVPIIKEAPFFIEAVNIGNKDGELIVSKKDDFVVIETPTIVPAKKNVFIKGKILIEGGDYDNRKNIIFDTKDISTAQFNVNIHYKRKDDLVINFGAAEFKDDKVHIPIYLNSFNFWSQPLEITLSSGKKLPFEKKIIKKGDSYSFYIVLDKDDFKKIIESFITIKINVKPF